MTKQTLAGIGITVFIVIAACLLAAVWLMPVAGVLVGNRTTQEVSEKPKDRVVLQRVTSLSPTEFPIWRMTDTTTGIVCYIVSGEGVSCVK